MGKCGILSLMLIALALATGCGGPYDSTVTGIVTLDGQQLSRGTVSFVPVAGGPAAYARIEEDGSYEVRTGRESGLPPGEYDVTVVANQPPAVQQTEAGGPPPPGKAITPPWYRTRDTSPLKFNIESGSNEINLELVTQPPPGWQPVSRRRG